MDMRETLIRFIREDDGSGLYDYALLLGIGAAIATILGTLLVPQIRAAITRAANTLQQTGGW